MIPGSMNSCARSVADKQRDLARIKGWRSAHPEKVREYNRISWDRVGYYTSASKKYGISKEDLLAMRERQGNLCAICRQPETVRVRDRVRPLHIDHDHDTGHVRGLLCSACNTGIGKFRDDPAALRAAADYLEANVGAV